MKATQRNVLPPQPTAIDVAACYSTTLLHAVSPTHTLNLALTRDDVVGHHQVQQALPVVELRGGEAHVAPERLNSLVGLWGVGWLKSGGSRGECGALWCIRTAANT